MEINLIKEKADIKNITDNNLNEIKNISSFFKLINSSFEEQINSLNLKIDNLTSKSNISSSSFFSKIIINLKQFNNNFKNTIIKIHSELINSIDLFITNQINVYQENSNDLNNLLLYYNNNNKILANSQFNYYKSCFNYIELEKIQAKKKKESFNINEDEYDIILKDKMEARNNEIIYKYEIEKYNKELNVTIDKYEKIKKKMELAELSRISFIKTSFEKHKNILKMSNDLLNNYIQSQDIIFSNDISEKIQNNIIVELSKFNEKTKESIISKKKNLFLLTTLKIKIILI